MKLIFNFQFSIFKKGFTLFELLIYIALISILLVVGSNIFIALNKGGSQAEAQNEVNSSLRFALLKINQDIRSALSVAVPATAGASADNIEMTVGGSTVKYCISTGKLRRQIDGTCNDASESITSDSVLVSDLTFTRLENTNTIFDPNVTTVSIKTDISISYNNASPDYQYSASRESTTSLR